MIMTPIVKWAGGKRQLLDEIKKHLPTTYGCYFEPFVGGGALLLDLHPQIAYINDYNEELISIYKCLNDRCQFEKMFTLCKEHEKHHCKDYYIQVRNLDREEKFKNLQQYEKAARCLYLNKACFNGLYRVNSKGEFNVPFNGKEIIHCFDDENIMNIHNYFLKSNINIFCGDFEKILSKVNKGDFVYFDPPYDVVNEQSFTSYTKGGFGRSDQIRLANCAKELSKKGAYVMISNSATDFIKDLYKDFNICIVLANRRINANANGRGNVEEVIITNY